MRYMLLIYSDESQEASASPEEQAAVFEAYNAFTKELRDSGAMLGGEAFQPTATAASVRVSNGKREVNDGPFAATGLQLGGYYMIEVENRDQALDWAAKLPGSKWGTVEVRPIMEFE